MSAEVDNSCRRRPAVAAASHRQTTACYLNAVQPGNIGPGKQNKLLLLLLFVCCSRSKMSYLFLLLCRRLLVKILHLQASACHRAREKAVAQHFALQATAVMHKTSVVALSRVAAAVVLHHSFSCSARAAALSVFAALRRSCLPTDHTMLCQVLFAPASQDSPMPERATY